MPPPSPKEAGLPEWKPLINLMVNCIKHRSTVYGDANHLIRWIPLVESCGNVCCELQKSQSIKVWLSRNPCWSVAGSRLLLSTHSHDLCYWVGNRMFPLVVHQPASPSIWPAVQSLRQGLSTNPGVTTWCVIWEQLKR